MLAIRQLLDAADNDGRVLSAEEAAKLDTISNQLVEMNADPVATTIVLLYTMLYAAATTAAVSAYFGAPLDTPRRSHVWLIIGIGRFIFLVPLLAVFVLVPLDLVEAELLGHSGVIGNKTGIVVRNPAVIA